METDISIQIKNTLDWINQLQYLISVTTCIHKRHYYYDLLYQYNYVYTKLTEIKNKQTEEHKDEK